MMAPHPPRFLSHTSIEAHWLARWSRSSGKWVHSVWAILVEACCHESSTICHDARVLCTVHRRASLRHRTSATSAQFSHHWVGIRVESRSKWTLETRCSLSQLIIEEEVRGHGIDTTQIRNKWDCWESSTQSKGRHLCSIVAIRSGWKLVDSMECCTCLRNIQDLLSDGKAPYEWRFGQPLKGPIIPFGSLVEYHTTTAKIQSRIHHFGKKVLPGLFLGYALYAGRIWKGDILVADIEDLETMDASEIYSKRLHAKEVIFPQKNGKFIFPVADDE